MPPPLSHSTTVQFPELNPNGVSIPRQSRGASYDALATLGMHSSFTGRWYDWWKVAETTFGVFMGMGLGIGTYFLTDKLPHAAPLEEPAAEAGFKTGSVILGLSCVS